MLGTETHSSKCFTWKNGHGKAKFKDLVMEVGKPLRIKSKKTGNVKTFEFHEKKYWMPMGTDGMYETHGYIYECDDITVYVQDLHDNDKRM